MTTIKLKNGSGAPLAGNLVQGEPALDLTNKRLYTENSSGTVIEVGTNPSTINIDAGTIDGTVIGGSTAAAGTFTTFTSTGIDDNAASTAITIDGSQNVGIGASPSYNFHVTGTGDTIAAVTAGASSIAGLNLGNDTNKADGGIRYDNSADALIFRASNAEKMRIDSSGNLGIGTSSPTSYSGQTNLNINSAGVSRIDFDISDALQGYALAESGYMSLFANTGNYLMLGANNTEAMRIDSSGNLGIGTSSPYANLHVTGTIKVATGNAQGILGLGEGNGSSVNVGVWRGAANAPTTDGNYLNLGGYEGMVFATGAATIGSQTERMRINSSGNVGIGTSSPSTRLSVRAGSANGIELDQDSDLATDSSRLFFNSSSGGYSIFNTSGSLRFNSGATAGSSSGTERMRIDASGNLLVGTTSQINSCKTNILGTNITNVLGLKTEHTNDLINGFSSTTETFRVSSTGNVTNLNNSYGSLSDERLKSNIIDASSQLDDIMAVQVRSYTLDSTGKTHIGVVAQELEASGMSGLVEEDKEGIKSVKYSVLYMKAIKALQEQNELINDLRARVTQLEGAN